MTKLDVNVLVFYIDPSILEAVGGIRIGSDTGKDDGRSSASALSRPRPLKAPGLPAILRRVERRRRRHQEVSFKNGIHLVRSSWVHCPTGYDIWRHFLFNVGTSHE